MAEPIVIGVREALARVFDPATGKNIVASGAVQGLEVSEDGVVRFTLEAGPRERKAAEALLARAREAAGTVKGVSRVSAVATGQAGTTTPPPRPRGGHDNPLGLGTEADAPLFPEIKTIIAVTSGKGGVGKSTIAAGLAATLAEQGFKTGFLDGDIYGPSAPTLFGLPDKAQTREGKIIPQIAHGVSVMSIGMLVDPEQALAWRGPMVMGALKQLMRDTLWGPLDFLIIDTPPGTGDAHLSLIQTKKLDGAIIVSTPQEMAIADVRRGVALFRKTDTPIIGILENMAWLADSNGNRQYIFGQGGAERAAQDLGTAFLGTMPIDPALGAAADNGSLLSGLDSPSKDEFNALAEKVVAFANRPPDR